MSFVFQCECCDSHFEWHALNIKTPNWDLDLYGPACDDCLECLVIAKQALYVEHIRGCYKPKPHPKE